MAVQPRDVLILRHLRRYFYLRTAQLRDLVAAHDRDGAITRGRLRALEKLGYVRRHQPKLIDPLDPQTAAPIWVLTLKGSNALATLTGDCSLLLTVEPTFKDWMSLNHYCGLGALGILLDAAVAAQDRVKLHALYYEHEVIRPDADDPARRYRLYTSFAPSMNVKCCPDAAFETELCGARRAWYVEREMGSDAPSRVAAKKHRGYAELARAQAFRRHFPEARDFRVLAFCPNAGWRDALRREMKDRQGAELWLFAATPEVTAESFLTAEILYTAERGPLRLAPPPPAAPSGPGRREERGAEG